MDTLTVALGQMDIALGDPAANLATARRLAGEARALGAELLLLPELWATGYDLERAGELADEVGAGAFAAVSALAREHGLAIGGSLLARRPGRPTNTATLYGPDGALLAEYSKIHLFGLMAEDRFLSAGQRAPVFDTPWGRGALAICYDLRFPELFRSYATRGAGLILLPSEWPYPRLEHWRTLVRARAIENQCFIVACNRVGRDRDNLFCGHSLAVDPWGETLVEGGDSPALLIAKLDLGAVVAVRNRMSVLRDRRPELYEFGVENSGFGRAEQ
jgi:predicted amidohydrolase